MFSVHFFSFHCFPFCFISFCNVSFHFAIFLFDFFLFYSLGFFFSFLSGMIFRVFFLFVVYIYPFKKSPSSKNLLQKLLHVFFKAHFVSPPWRNRKRLTCDRKVTDFESRYRRIMSWYTSCGKGDLGVLIRVAIGLVRLKNPSCPWHWCSARIKILNLGDFEPLLLSWNIAGCDVKQK